MIGQLSGQKITIHPNASSRNVADVNAIQTQNSKETLNSKNSNSKKFQGTTSSKALLDKMNRTHSFLKKDESQEIKMSVVNMVPGEDEQMQINA